MRRVVDRLRRSRALTALELAAALLAVLLAVLAPGRRDADAAPRLALMRASGALAIANSREGEAIFRADNMRPGEQASGTVRLTNTGTLPAAMSVAPTLAGGPAHALARRLSILVFDITDVQRPRTMYAGSLMTMGSAALGTLAEGDARDYLVVASLPSTGRAAENGLQGASLEAGFAWTATAAADAPAAAPTASPTPAATPTTPRPQAPAACARRTAAIRVKAPRGQRVRGITVRVTGVQPRAYPRRRRLIRVVVSGPAARAITVKLELDRGRARTIRRRVPTCAA